MSMQRSEFEGFRYKPREVRWVGDDEDNFALKREFENIAATTNGLVDRLASVFPKDITDRMGGSTAEPQDKDESVRVNENDPIAAHLARKLIFGNGLDVRIDNGLSGLAMHVSLASETIIEAYDFTTLVDAQGRKIPENDARRLYIVIPHNIPNEYYTYDIFRPYEDVDSSTPDLHPDGSTRGRFQIRYKNDERKPNSLRIDFHRPEYGTVVLFGSRAVRRGTVHHP